MKNYKKIDHGVYEIVVEKITYLLERTNCHSYTLSFGKIGFDIDFRCGIVEAAARAINHIEKTTLKQLLWERLDYVRAYPYSVYCGTYKTLGWPIENMLNNAIQQVNVNDEIDRLFEQMDYALLGLETELGKNTKSSVYLIEKIGLLDRYMKRIIKLQNLILSYELEVSA